MGESDAECILLFLLPEVRLEVFCNLGARDIWSIRKTCVTLCDESRNSLLWKLLCKRDYFDASAVKTLSFPLPKLLERREQIYIAKKQKNRKRVNTKGGPSALQTLPAVCVEQFGMSWEWFYSFLGQDLKPGGPVGRKSISFRRTAIDRIAPLDDDLERWMTGERAETSPISQQQIDDAELHFFKECKKGQRSLSRRPLTPFLHYLKDLPRDADFDVNKQAVIFFNLSQEEKAGYVERSQQEKIEMERSQPKKRRQVSRILDDYGLFIGKWKRNGQLDGYGIALYASGERYEGEWRDNKRNGWGIMWWPRKMAYVGGPTDEWKTWERYEGRWKDGYRDGEGIKYGRNGKVCHAIWSEDAILSVIDKYTPLKSRKEK